MKKIALVAILLASLCAAWLISPLSSGTQAVVSRVLVRKAATLFRANPARDAFVSKPLIAHRVLDSEVPL